MAADDGETGLGVPTDDRALVLAFDARDGGITTDVDGLHVGERVGLWRFKLAVDVATGEQDETETQGQDGRLGDAFGSVFHKVRS